MRRSWWAWLLPTWAASAGYAGWMLMRGWVPHDEGTFGESALRVLAGELPHRDFDELYTGGLSYLHALAFEVLGITATSLRLVLFGWFLAWVPAVFYVASRFVSRSTAAAVTLLCVAWSIPNYAAPVPSWYNLFFATFGVAALLRHLERGSPAMLFFAGLCGGLSFVMKSVGVFYAAGVVLFFLFREQCIAAASPGEKTVSPVYRAWIVVALVGLVGALQMLVISAGSVAFVQFVVPGATLAMVVAWREWRGVDGAARARFATLAGMLLPFAAGFLLPVLVLLAPYFASGALDTFVRGVFVLPTRRLAFSTMELAPLSSGAPIVLLLLPLIACSFGSTALRAAVTAVALAFLGFTLVASRTVPDVYAFGWHALDFVVPTTMLAGSVLVGRAPARSEPLMLVLCVAAFADLVRFPFSAPIYFCYAAPLIVLAVTAVLASMENPPRLLLAGLLAFYTLFAVLRVTPTFIHNMGSRHLPDLQTTRLTIPRAAGLRVTRMDAEVYERLIPLIQAHARGDYTWAGPDCPEIYFLSGLRNPRRTIFDFFDDPEGRRRDILDTIEAHGVSVVVICTHQDFSPRDPELESALTERFPAADGVGRFVVRWRP